MCAWPSPSSHLRSALAEGVKIWRGVCSVWEGSWLLNLEALRTALAPTISAVRTVGVPLPCSFTKQSDYVSPAMLERVNGFCSSLAEMSAMDLDGKLSIAGWDTKFSCFLFPWCLRTPGTGRRTICGTPGVSEGQLQNDYNELAGAISQGIPAWNLPCAAGASSAHVPFWSQSWPGKSPTLTSSLPLCIAYFHIHNCWICTEHLWYKDSAVYF